MRKMTSQQTTLLLILSMVAIKIAFVNQAINFSDSTICTDIVWMIAAILLVSLLIPGPGIFLWRNGAPYDKKYGSSIERRIHRRIEKGTAYMA